MTANDAGTAAAAGKGGVRIDREELNTVLLLVLSSLGIYATFLTHGVMHERLATETYGEAGERFPDLAAVTTLQSVASAVAAAAILLLQGRLLRPGPGVAPLLAWLPPALTHSVGPPLGSYALRFIPFSAVVIVKASKMVPVMLMNVVWNRQRYSRVEYLCTLLIASGVAFFSLSSSGRATAKLASHSPVVGYLLVAANVLIDGWTSAFQDGIRKRYPQSSPLHIMLGMNALVSAVSVGGHALAELAGPVLAAVLPGAAGGAFLGGGGASMGETLRFSLAHPKAGGQLLLMSAAGVLGQMFVFLLIARFGTLVTSTVTTTRKFFSILCSVVVNGSPLQPIQWLGVAGVFSGIGIKTVVGHRKAVEAKQAKQGQQARKEVRFAGGAGGKAKAS